MTVEAFPDTEGACRTWLRTKTTLTAVVAQRIFFGVPDDASETDFPLITVQRLGGGGDASEAPLDVASLQIDCWGNLRGKAVVLALANAVRSEINELRTATAWDGTVTCLGATVENISFMVDPEDQRPRYSLTVQAVTRTGAP